MQKFHFPRLTTKHLAFNAVIAALYFVLSYYLQPLSFGAIQFRVAEAMTILPLFNPYNIIGLTVGCLVTNLLSPFGAADIVVGTLATLIAGCLTYACRKRPLVGAAFPVLVNAILLPFVWALSGAPEAYIVNFSTVLVSQAVIVYCLGIPLYHALKRTKLFREA